MELKLSEKISLKYHDIFDYPLREEELKKWKVNIDNIHTKEINLSKIKKLKIKKKDGFYFLKGREVVINKRIGREKASRKKLVIAKRAAKVLEKIPYIKFVGITGALAMNNAGKESDIDLMIITKANKLWTTRLLTYVFLLIMGFKIRKPGDKNEKDKLCLNMWLDETSLEWSKKDRNIYTAHEIMQIIPLVNKNNIYESLLAVNNWVFNFWKKSEENIKLKNSLAINKNNEKASLLEKFFYKLQRLYMHTKLTNELIEQHFAFFHPNSWGDKVITKLSS